MQRLSNSMIRPVAFVVEAGGDRFTGPSSGYRPSAGLLEGIARAISKSAKVVGDEVCVIARRQFSEVGYDQFLKINTLVIEAAGKRFRLAGIAKATESMPEGRRFFSIIWKLRRVLPIFLGVLTYLSISSAEVS